MEQNDGVTDSRRKPNLFRLTLSWEERHDEGLVNSSGCKIVNMALIFLYKLYKNGKRMVPEPLLAAGGRCSGPKHFCFQEHRYKNWHIILVEKDKCFSECSTASFQPNVSHVHVKVKGGKDERVVGLFLK